MTPDPGFCHDATDLDGFAMHQAYCEALKALDQGEVPVGAVITRGGRIIGRGHNRVESLGDATAHAEIIAIGAAATSLNSWRLDECTLYVTLEPCLMCCGAIMQSRLSTIVYASPDPRYGAIDSRFYRQEIEQAYRRFPLIRSGVLQKESTALLAGFFRDVRKKN